jgi:hypothetical protein
MLYLLVSACTLTSCIEEYNADISAEDSNLLVVEGTICAEQQNRFYLTRTQALNSSTPPRSVTGAKVSVRGSDGSEYQALAASGYYACQLGQLNPDATYYLHIETDGEIYESEPQQPLRTEKIAEIRGVQNTPYSNIDVLVTPADPFASSEPKYYMWTYDETWQVYPDYMTTMYYDTEIQGPVFISNPFPWYGWVDATGSTNTVGASTSYDNQHIRNLKIYDIGRNNVRMYHRYSGLVHQRAISKGEYEYELARRQASTEMGGLFTPLPSTLPTNIHCLTSNKHVIGFIGCSMNTSDYRFFLNGSEFNIHHPTINDARRWLENPNAGDCLHMVKLGFYLCEWVIPEMADDGKLHTAWATIQQLDVRYKYPGAYIEEPDFWSLQENVSY